MKHNWEYKKLGDICSIVGRIGFRGYTRDDLVEKGNGAISLSPSNIIDGKLNFDDKVSYLSWEKYYESPEIMLAEGDVVFTKTASIGKCALVKKLPVETTLNPQLVVLKNIQCDSSYLTYTLQDKRFQEAVLSKKGGTSIPTISQAFLGSLPVPVPPIETQKQIVAELDKINETIEDCRELLRNLDDLAQSLFYDFFGDPITNPKKWQIKKIKEIGKVITGSTPSTKVEDYYNSHDICFVKPGDIDNSISYISDTKDYISNFAFDSCCRKLPMGTVVVTCIGIIGKVGVLKVEANCNQQINAVIPFDAINNIYLAYILKEYAPLFTDAATGPVVKILNKSSFSEFSIPVPPLEIQEKFAARMEEIEAQKKTVESTIAVLQTLLDSRMDYWFN